VTRSEASQAVTKQGILDDGSPTPVPVAGEIGTGASAVTCARSPCARNPVPVTTEHRLATRMLVIRVIGSEQDGGRFDQLWDPSLGV
jgi:hypothetical protein